MFALTPFGHRFGADSYNPFREFDDMEKKLFGSGALVEFKTDIREKDGKYLLEADLPGFRKEDIRISLEGGYMTITAVRKAEKEEKDEKGKYIRSERSFGSFSRTFDMTGVDCEKIDASYKDGVLTVMMPKKEKEEKKDHLIEIR